MFKSYQSQLIRQDIEIKKRNNVLKFEKETVAKSVLRKATRYLILFLETSSIHGLNHLVVPRRHVCEIFLWLLMVGFSVFGSVYLSWATWIRYQLSPTVVSMDRDMFSWNTSFPAITMCLDKKLDEEKLMEYLRNQNKDNYTSRYMGDFIRALSNATFDNFDKIPKYNELAPEKYLNILTSLAPAFKPILTIGAADVNLEVVPTVTEMGLCYAVNSKVAIYSSPEYISDKRWDIVQSKEETFFVHPLDGEVFAQVIRIPSSYNVYLHGPFEVPDISTRYQHSAEQFYLKLYVTALAVYTTPEAGRLSVAQRRCRFLHENNLEHFPVYSYTMCRMECRIRLCLKYCQCIPFFYRKRDNEVICDQDGMQCLANYKVELNTLRDKQGKKLTCGCYPICDEVNYVIQINPLQEWFMGTNFQWGMVTYPRIRYRRDIIFGFTDVLVAVGGMAGLFLGCSVLSFMEIIYFITLRLFCYTYKALKK